jgi:hypothetical protein
LDSFVNSCFVPPPKAGIPFLLIVKFGDVGNLRRMERPEKG